MTLRHNDLGYEPEVFIRCHRSLIVWADIVEPFAGQALKLGDDVDRLFQNPGQRDCAFVDLAKAEASLGQAA